jgi:hypothetical protein
VTVQSLLAAKLSQIENFYPSRRHSSISLTQVTKSTSFAQNMFRLLLLSSISIRPAELAGNLSRHCERENDLKSGHG